jgi:hypothetical protein
LKVAPPATNPALAGGLMWTMSDKGSVLFLAIVAFMVALAVLVA